MLIFANCLSWNALWTRSNLLIYLLSPLHVFIDRDVRHWGDVRYLCPLWGVMLAWTLVWRPLDKLPVVIWLWTFDRNWELLLDSEGCPSNQVSAAAMTSASDEKCRPFNCFFQSGRAKDLSAPLVTSSLLGSNIILNTLFSNTLSLCSSLNISDQVSHPHKKIFFPYVNKIM